MEQKTKSAIIIKKLKR